jgi:hypothetical protein
MKILNAACSEFVRWQSGRVTPGASRRAGRACARTDAAGRPTGERVVNCPGREFATVVNWQIHQISRDVPWLVVNLPGELTTRIHHRGALCLIVGFRSAKGRPFAERKATNWKRALVVKSG